MIPEKIKDNVMCKMFVFEKQKTKESIIEWKDAFMMIKIPRELYKACTMAISRGVMVQVRANHNELSLKNWRWIQHKHAIYNRILDKLMVLYEDRVCSI